jgi:hypothetical protein
MLVGVQVTEVQVHHAYLKTHLLRYQNLETL